MFMHTGFRPLWPVVAFVPWLLFGVACLVYAAAQRGRESPGAPAARARAPLLSRARQLRIASVVGLAFLAAARAVVADPAGEKPRACEVTTVQEARSLADRLYEKGEYQRAGECYQAAGDLTHANLAFLQAAGPTGKDAARGLRTQGDAARALFAGVGRAFRGNH